MAQLERRSILIIPRNWMPHSAPSDSLRKSISILLSTLAALFLICVITGAIVVTALTVYVMNFKDDISNVTIEEMELSYNTNIFAYDAEGNLKMLYEVSNAAERVPVSIDEIPQHVRDAFVYTPMTV